VSLTDSTRQLTVPGVPPAPSPTAAPRPRRSLELREWRPSDAGSLQRALAGCDELRHQLSDGDLSSAAACADLIERSLAIRFPSLRNFAVSLSGRAVGNVAVSHMEHRCDTGWVSYWLAEDVRGRGLATRAVATVAGWAFAEQDLFRLELGHRVSNDASCGVAMRAGFATEGVERQKLKQGEQRYDVETHARLRTDRYPHLELIPIR
jgi:ribosomal-protein-alanine N-acetyltransferase